MITFNDKTKTPVCSSYNAMGINSIVGGVFENFLKKKMSMEDFIKDMQVINIEIYASNFNEINQKEFIKDFIKDDIISLEEIGITVDKTSFIFSKI